MADAKQKWSGLFPDLGDTFARFPMAAVVAVLVAIALNAMIFIGGEDTGIFTDVSFTGGAAFLGALAGHLFAEGRTWSFQRNLLAAVLFAVVPATFVYFYNTFSTYEYFVFLGLWLLIKVAPFLHASAKQGAIWLFNFKLYLVFLLSILVECLFGGGLSAVAAGLDFLLDITISNDIYQHIWVTAGALVGPLYFLSLLPKSVTEDIDIADHKGTTLERAESVVVNYVLVPLVFVYAVILHAYAVKIIIGGALPKGEIGTIVSWFTIIGTLTWLLAWPWREEGTRLLRLFMRYWFWLMPVPIVLLSVAIWRRVTDYGVTPDRYAVALVAVWAVIVCSYLLWRRNRADMRVLIGSAAVLLLVGSFGPQGAYSVTGRSQMAQLTKALIEKGMLIDGKFVKKSLASPSATPFAGASILYALADVRRLEAAYLLLGQAMPDDVKRQRSSRSGHAYTLAETVGFNSISQNVDQFSISSRESIAIPIDGKSKLIGPVSLSSSTFEKIDAPVKGASIKVEGAEFLVITPQYTARKNVSELTQIFRAHEAQKIESPAVLVDFDPRVKLIVTQAYGSAGDKPQINSLEAWVVLKD
jgi:hypothetical protein